MSKGQHSNGDWRSDPVKTFYIGLGMGTGVSLLVFLVVVIGVLL